jgi:bacteriocin-like protein
MIPKTKQESEMSDEIHELSIDELDTVSGGQVTTTTVLGPIQRLHRLWDWAVQRQQGQRDTSSIPGF